MKFRRRRLDAEWCALIARRWNNAPWPTVRELAIEYEIGDMSVRNWLEKASSLGMAILSPGERNAYKRAAEKYALKHNKVVG